MLKYSLLSASIALALGLSACGGSSSSDAARTATSGVLVDDLIVGATVFCDLNNDGLLDSNEESVTTDDSGTFTFANGCDAPIVSVAGTGVDKTSSKSPSGKLRGKRGSKVVSHFTTMQLESGLSDADFSAIMAKLGLGNIDPSTFNPADPAEAAKLKTAMAVAKLLNDLAAIVTAAGGDAEAAFAAAAKELASQLKGKTLTGASLFDNDVDLGDVIEAAADKAFDSVPNWSDKNDSTAVTRKTNAKKLTRAGLVKASKTVKNAASDDDAKDAFRNEQTSTDIDNTNLEDDNATTTKVTEVENDDNYNKSDKSNVKKKFVYSDSDKVFLVGANQTVDTTLSALSSGRVSTEGLTLRDITRIEMPLRDPEKTLSKNGVTAMVALEVTEVGGSRKLQVYIDKVVLSRDPNVAGQVRAVVPGNVFKSNGSLQSAGAGMRFYARSGSGVQMFTSEPIRNLAANTLSSSATGKVGIDLKVIMDRLFSSTTLTNSGTGTTNTALLNDLLDKTGQFDVKVIVTQADFRYSNGTTLPYSTINLKISPTKGLSIGGGGFTGHLTF